MKIIKPSYAIEERSEERGGLTDIEKAARTCYRTEARIGEGSAETMVRMLIRRGHDAMLEHGDYAFMVDDYHIFDNVAYSLRRLFEETGDAPRLAMTSGRGRHIISGNIRAWRELIASGSAAAYYFTGAIDPIYTEDLIPDAERVDDPRVRQIRYAELVGAVEQRAHLRQTVRFVIDRGISHEFVRHRVMSFAQESSRYCVAGSARLTASNPHIQGMTVEELYRNRVDSKNGAWKRIRIRQYNEDTGELVFSNIREIVCNGEKPCIRIKTKLGYELVCTADHRVLTPNGYVEAENIGVGGRVYVNGTEALYTNRDWLYHQSITLNKTFVAIANEFGFNVSTLKSWARKLHIPKKGTGYFKIGQTPWNKGVIDERQANALREYHHCGRRKEGIMKQDTVNYQKHKGTACAVCGTTDALEVHHVDCDHGNNTPDNLITVCQSCHQRIHSQNLLTAYADEVVEIADAGIQTVYDIEMASDYHNFVANGVIVHNCNYSDERFGGEITVIEPCYLAPDSGAYYLWQRQCMTAETTYFALLDVGLLPEEARGVLPQSVRTELVVTGTLGGWQHFFDLRALDKAGKPHPQAREVAEPLCFETARRYPGAIITG